MPNIHRRRNKTDIADTHLILTAQGEGEEGEGAFEDDAVIPGKGSYNISNIAVLNMKLSYCSIQNSFTNRSLLTHL